MPGSMTVTLTATHAAVLPSMPSSISVPELIAQGKPFVEFPKYSILDLRCETGLGGAEGSGEAVTSGNGTGGTGSTGFADWLTRKLQIGHPFVIQGFDKLPEWDKQLFSIDGLIDLSTKKSKILSFYSLVISQGASHRRWDIRLWLYYARSLDISSSDVVQIFQSETAARIGT